MTLDEFLEAHPEFNGTVDPSYISATLAQATRRCDPAVYGKTIDDAIGWMTGDLLARSPMGGATRLEPGDTTIYELELNRLIEESGAGMALVAGGSAVLPGRFGCR